MGKLSYEDKVNLYYDRKMHIPLSTISKKYKTAVDNIQFLERLIDKHGFERTAEVLDYIKSIGYKYSTKGAITVSVADVSVPEAKKDILSTLANNGPP